MKTGVIDFAIFKNGKEYLGAASVQLPDIVHKVISYSGAGLGGDIELPTAKVDPMEVTINWTTVTEAAYQLSTLRQHQIELRAVHQGLDRKAAAIAPEGVKYVLTVMPKSVGLGQVQPASPQAISGTYACHSVKMYMGGKLVRHVDPINNINWDADNGNALAAYNKILGR